MREEENTVGDPETPGAGGSEAAQAGDPETPGATDDVQAFGEGDPETPGSGESATGDPETPGNTGG
ncbi:MAG TPA: hypothetical protein VF791_16210 [Pyrinomonadaceae bacterium]